MTLSILVNDKDVSDFLREVVSGRDPKTSNKLDYRRTFFLFKEKKISH